MKPSKLQDHLRRCHPDKTEKDLKFFQTLKDKYFRRGLYWTECSLRRHKEIMVCGRLTYSKIRKTTYYRRENSLKQQYCFLCNYLQTTHFSIQLDESTLPDNAALLLAYVRFIMNQEIYEELLFARTLITDTKGESIFHVLKDYFIEKPIPLSNIISVATDGVTAMVGRYRGFISYLKQNVSGVLHESLHLVIDAVNRIRSNALNTRLFAQLCEKNDEHFHQLLLHTVERFFALFETILEFLDTKDKILKENLMKRKTDIAYLTDLFTKFNMVNLQLQGDSLNLIKTKSILSAFLARFPNLSQTSCQEDDVSTYVQHLYAFYSDFESRFEDILTMVIPPCIINPYGDIEETNFKNGYQQFWLQNNIPVTYPILWNIVRKFLISFPSSYLVERGFSAVTNFLTKKRNRLDIISRGDIRLTLTKLTQNVDN
ncbi:unnamed protein product [Acanthoscelides obtectus]|uniref:Uncharacterized protein n=1 Tax=Acanthoscelides obtectus TaxID=200917 RepID=A0A9P0L7I0_ACAOB|nr:unnamed protein product [Acanthoscelides obtectus]CAK1673081.1 Protein ZBED8 [Acanthoscelides obtectus]